MPEKRVKVQRGRGGRKRRKKEMLAEVERATGGELQVDGLNFKAARPDEVCGLTM